jgi:hypothetical protein
MRNLLLIWAKATHADVPGSGVLCRRTFGGRWTPISFLSLPRLFGFLGNTDKTKGMGSTSDRGRMEVVAAKKVEHMTKDNHARAVCRCLVEE